MTRIVIGGDVCPTRADTPCFIDGDAASIFHDLADEFRAADLAVVNLECPLTDEDSPIAKCGPNLRAPAACMAGIRNAGIHVLNLANNHILDHGPQGLESTLQAAEAAGIATVGAGRNRDEARRILVRSAGGLRVGILGVAEHEFSIATAASPGANPLDVIDVTRNIRENREHFDYLVALVHGGAEGYPLPSPGLMDTCRFLVEQGAGAVICQHSHCPGCYEEYHGGHIVYGQGNLVFSGAAQEGPWTEGFLVELCIAAAGAASMRFVPYAQSRAEIGAHRLQGGAADLVLRAIEERSQNIRQEGFVQAEWERMCKKRSKGCLSILLGHGRLGRLSTHVEIVKYLYSPFDLLVLENTVRCETHHEILKTVLAERNRSPRSRE